MASVACNILPIFQGPGVQVVALVPAAGPVPPLDLLGANKVDMRIDTTGGKDLTFTGNHLGARPNNDGDIVLNIGIARFTNAGNAAVFNAYIGFSPKRTLSPVVGPNIWA